MSAYFTYQPNSKAETPEDVCINAEVRLGFSREPKILFKLIRIQAALIRTPTVGLEPTTTRLRALRSTD